MHPRAWTDSTFIHDAAAFVKDAVARGVTFSAALRSWCAHESVTGVPPLFYKQVIASAFSVGETETSIFGGWNPEGPSSVSDAQLDRSLFDSIIEASTDVTLLRKTMCSAYKGYSCREGASEYFTVEQLADGKEVVRIEFVEQNGRNLIVTYSAPLSTGARAARRIALFAIFHELLDGKYDGAVDRVVWIDSERGRKYEDAYIPSSVAR